MKNLRYLRRLKAEDLAPMLIKPRKMWVYDTDSEGCYYICAEGTEFQRPDGGVSIAYEDALVRTIEWLKSDRKQ